MEDNSRSRSEFILESAFPVFLVLINLSSLLSEILSILLVESALKGWKTQFISAK